MPKEKKIKHPWQTKSPSQLSPEEKLAAYEAAGIKLVGIRKPGGIQQPKTKRR